MPTYWYIILIHRLLLGWRLTLESHEPKGNTGWLSSATGKLHKPWQHSYPASCSNRHFHHLTFGRTFLWLPLAGDQLFLLTLVWDPKYLSPELRIPLTFLMSAFSLLLPEFPIVNSNAMVPHTAKTSLPAVIRSRQLRVHTLGQGERGWKNLRLIPGLSLLIWVWMTGTNCREAPRGSAVPSQVLSGSLSTSLAFKNL